MNLTLETVIKSPISIEEKFDFLYGLAEEILAKYKPCRIKFLKNGANCLGCKSGYVNPNELCCDGCQFHTDKGCVAEKPLMCKLWLCGDAGLKFKKCGSQLYEIYQIAEQLDLLFFRGDKKMSLNNAKKSKEIVRQYDQIEISGHIKEVIVA